MHGEKRKETLVVVEGRGPFPTDMLRYDSCCPARSQDAGVIDAANSYLGVSDGKLQRVVLRRYSPDGKPASVERWRSMGWHVIADSAADRVSAERFLAQE